MSLAQMHCYLGRALCLKHKGLRRRQRLAATQTMCAELPKFLESVSTILYYRSKDRIGASKNYNSSETKTEHCQKDSYVTYNFASQMI